jgi:hypothetical protein
LSEKSCDGSAAEKDDRKTEAPRAMRTDFIFMLGENETQREGDRLLIGKKSRKDM